MSAKRADVRRRQSRFEALYVEHYGSIYAYVYRRLAEIGAEVPDVVAEVFAVAWRRIDEVPTAPADRLWLYGVARRCVSRARRSDWRRVRLQARLADEARRRPSADGVQAASSEVPLLAAIERLRPLNREVLLLVVWERLSHADAAQVLGCSVNAVALRLHKTKRRLRAELAIPESRSAESVPDLEPWS